MKSCFMPHSPTAKAKVLITELRLPASAAEKSHSEMVLRTFKLVLGQTCEEAAMVQLVAGKAALALSRE